MASKGQFTWWQVSRNLYSRIDYWLVQNKFVDNVESTDIRSSIKTDHAVSKTKN